VLSRTAIGSVKFLQWITDVDAERGSMPIAPSVKMAQDRSQRCASCRQQVRRPRAGGGTLPARNQSRASQVREPLGENLVTEARQEPTKFAVVARTFA
jgi:hypothetical protein